jgi:hypothetical protein
MSEYNHTDPIKLAEAAERDLNSYQAKQGLNNSSDSGTPHNILSTGSKIADVFEQSNQA